jgi:hypothetical protein
MKQHGMVALPMLRQVLLPVLLLLSALVGAAGAAGAAAGVTAAAAAAASTTATAAARDPAAVAGELSAPSSTPAAATSSSFASAAAVGALSENDDDDKTSIAELAEAEEESSADYVFNDVLSYLQRYQGQPTTPTSLFTAAVVDAGSDEDDESTSSSSQKQAAAAAATAAADADELQALSDAWAVARLEEIKNLAPVPPPPGPPPTPPPFPPPLPPAPPPQPQSKLNGFVQRAGVRFVVQSRAATAAGAKPSESCENFYFVGTNNYYLMVRAADPRLRCEVLEVLDSAADLGISVIRTWGFSDGATEWNALQREPGVYNERTFVGMDYVLHQASLRGIRLLIAFGNYWQHYGGVDTYNRWSYRAGQGSCDGDLACRDDFFSDPYARQMYKNHIKAFVNRRNTFSGLLYRDDPAIFGWNLMNEPRWGCTSCIPFTHSLQAPGLDP